MSESRRRVLSRLAGGVVVVAVAAFMSTPFVPQTYTDTAAEYGPPAVIGLLAVAGLLSSATYWPRRRPARSEPAPARTAPALPMPRSGHLPIAAAPADYRAVAALPVSPAPRHRPAPRPRMALPAGNTTGPVA